MMKMIMPMASPATVSVSQVLGEPMKGSTSSASAGTSASGFQSKSRVFMHGLLLRRQWPHAQTSPRTRRWPHRKTLLI